MYAIRSYYGISGIYLAIVFGQGASVTLWLSNCSCIFSGDSKGFSLWIRLIKAIVLVEILGLPDLLHLVLQYTLNAVLGKPVTVSGLMITRLAFQLSNALDNITHS